MAISRETKERLVAEYGEKFSGTEVTIFTDYRGLSVAEMSDLRNRLREKGAEFHVVKNSLVQRALQGLDYPVPDQQLEGPTAVCFCGDDVASSAQLLVDAERRRRLISIKGGLTRARVLDVEGATGLVRLPPKQVLLGQVVGTVQSPLVSLVSVLSAPLRGLVTVLKARAEQLETAVP